MDMPSSSRILLPTSPNGLVTEKSAGPSGGNKRKRSLDMSNFENTEERPKEKRVRKRRSNNYKHLTPEEAEERRKRVNKQERLRQKKNSEATDRLRRLNLPNNPNLPNHKKGSSIYVYSTVSNWMEALQQKCVDNGIDPRMLKIPDLPDEPVSDESESDDPGVVSGPISSVYSGPSQPLCAYEQESRDEPSTSRVYQNKSTRVPQSGNKLADANIHQNYSYGNMHPQYHQNNIINLENQMSHIQQPISFGYKTVPGLHNGTKRFMTQNNLVPQAAFSKVQQPEHSRTGGAINGYHNIRGSHDVPITSSHTPIISSIQTIRPTLLASLLRSTSDPAGQSPFTVLSPLGLSGQLQVLSPPGQSGQLKALSPPGQSGQLQVHSPPCLSGQLQVLSPPGLSGQLQVLSPPGHSGQLQVLSPPGQSGHLQVLSPPGQSGQLQVLSPPGQSGHLQVLSPPGQSGQLQVLSPPGQSGQLQVLSPPGQSGQLQVLSLPGQSGQLQVLSPPCHSGQLQALSPPGHFRQLQVQSPISLSGQLQILSHPGQLGQSQILSASGQFGQTQVLSASGQFGQSQVLLASGHFGQPNALSPPGQSGQVKVLSTPGQLGQSQVLSTYNRFGQTQVKIPSPSDHSGHLSSGTPSPTTLTPSPLTTTLTPDSVQHDSEDTDEESYDWLLSWDL